MENKKVSYGFTIEALRKGDLFFEEVASETGLSFKEALYYVKKFSNQIKYGHFRKDYLSRFQTYPEIKITLDKYSDWNEEAEYWNNIDYIEKYSKRYKLINGEYKKVKY